MRDLTTWSENSGMNDREARHRPPTGVSASFEGGSRTRQEVDEILRFRAQALSAPTQTETHLMCGTEVLEFVLARERYGIETEYIREVCPLKELTRVPLVPRFVLGILNIRGQVTSLIDLRRFFDLPEKGLAERSRVILVKGDRLEFGVLADEVLGVRSFSLDSLQGEIPTLTGRRRVYFRGVSPDGTILLDLKAILSDREIVVRQNEEN